ncbi:hypothetical protein DY000_02004204 [Brassica cretica]|uniref:No apical meristem-associated C-terminal domain-containing protein n=1 Tax=Brassica cretica TaxID=69181 RepID=A0ABQ7C8A3_BRACR|nr:hypothetical protein DY000_02004204 [Brassica cretica]
MDSNPNPNFNFVDLLQSQQESGFGLESSSFPLFGTQATEATSHAFETDTAVDEQGSKRPPGVKAEKARGKKKMVDGKDLSEYQTMWVIRQQDLASKERLSKIKLLESLIAKQEFADYEEALKKKLIDELMST